MRLHYRERISAGCRHAELDVNSAEEPPRRPGIQSFKPEHSSHTIWKAGLPKWMKAFESRFVQRQCF